MVPTIFKSEEIWAKISSDGVLTYFDGKVCKRLSEEYLKVGHDQNRALAWLCTGLLNHVAKEVDHILKPGGGTYGDYIRQLSIPSQTTEKHNG